LNLNSIHSKIQNNDLQPNSEKQTSHIALDDAVV